MQMELMNPIINSDYFIEDSQHKLYMRDLIDTFRMIMKNNLDKNISFEYNIFHIYNFLSIG